MKSDPKPRIMLAATASGSGKTTVTCAVLQALINRGNRVTAFKCGSDYIDPMFHSEVIGANSRNLDLYMMSENTVKYLLNKNSVSSDISVIEGVMGFYDGVGGNMENRASAYDLAKVTKTPVILIVDAKGMSDSVAAIIKGFLTYREDSNIKGVLLNRVHPMSYPAMKQLIERELHLPVVGYLPYLKECSLESRHLGLVTAAEVDQLKEKTETLAKAAAENIDFDLLEQLASSAEPFEFEPISVKKLPAPVRIAIAKDHAFCFYYRDALDLLEDAGAELVDCSPISDCALPEDIDGIFLGGGYPEVYADELSSNKSFLADLNQKINNGLPCYAECGGFMYLHERMQDENGNSYPMAGIIQGESFRTDHLVRFGYIELTASHDSLTAQKGERVRAHEFHYWDSTNSGDTFTAKRATGSKEWDCIVSTDTLHAGYPHVHFYSNPQFAYRFLERCLAYRSNETK